MKAINPPYTFQQYCDYKGIIRQVLEWSLRTYIFLMVMTALWPMESITRTRGFYWSRYNINTEGLSIRRIHVTMHSKSVHHNWINSGINIRKKLCTILLMGTNLIFQARRSCWNNQTRHLPWEHHDGLPDHLYIKAELSWYDFSISFVKTISMKSYDHIMYRCATSGLYITIPPWDTRLEESFFQ